jgi:hypothetical protein
MKPVALLLIALGALGLIFGGISYNRQTTLFEVGGMKATTTEHKTIPIAPLLGVVSLVGGIALLMAERRRA